MEYRYTGIMLKKREIGETDRLYTFFSREKGKIVTLARGVRKSEAKLASSLETATLSDIMVARSRGMGKITGAVLEESYPALHGDYLALLSVTRFLADFDRLVEPEEEDTLLFELLSSYLAAVEMIAQDKHGERASLLTEAAYQKFFVALGYELELSRCVVSGERLSAGGRYAISFEQGGMVGEEHFSSLRDGLPVSENAIKLLRLFLAHSFENLSKLTAGAADIDELGRLRKAMLAWIRR